MSAASAGLVPGALAATRRVTWGRAVQRPRPRRGELLRPLDLAPVPAA
jgi:hypothetical protein